MNWKDPYDEEPVGNEVLALSPEGVLILTGWRKAYGIFDCQGKRDSIFGWKYAEIELPIHQEKMHRQATLAVQEALTKSEIEELDSLNKELCHL